MKKIILSILAVLFSISILAQSPVKIWTGSHSSTVTSVDFLPDGRVLSASYDGTVKLWATNGVGTVIYISPFVAGRYLPINSVATDGIIIVAGMDGGLVQVINGPNFNIGVDVLGVSVNNSNVSAVGRTNLVYVNGISSYQSLVGYNYCVVSVNEGLVWGSTDTYVRTSWGYSYSDSDWILSCDFNNFNTTSVGLSSYVKMNGQVIFVLPQKGASSIHINRINGKLLVSDWNLNIYVIRSSGGFLDGIVEKNFKEQALVRSSKWSPDGSKFAYGTSDGRVVLALPEYAPIVNVTNPPAVKGKGRK